MSSFFKNKKRCIIISSVVMFLLIAVFLGIILVPKIENKIAAQKLEKNALMSQNYEYTGKEYFDNETYLEFAQGMQFQQVLHENYILDCGEVVDFYHRDNTQFEPRNVNYPDVYALDVQVEDEIFKEIRNSMIAGKRYAGTYENYSLYEVPYEEDEQGEIVNSMIVLICINENESKVRCVMFSDIKLCQIIQFTISRYSEMDWL